MNNKKSNIKKRNWAFVVYPTKEQLAKLNSKYDGSDGYGSVPDDWKQKLNLSGLQYAISPLHDKDELEDKSGKTKKPHYHVIICYGSPTTYNNVKNLTDSLNSPIPQALEQVRGYYRYFTHKDNADKYQYDEKEKFSETNPLSEDPDATTSKPIKDLYKELFNDDWDI